MRSFDADRFDAAFNDVVTAIRWQEEALYYPRYRSRYELVLRRFATLAPDRPLDVLEVGGGQLALLAQVMWGDRATVADIDPSTFEQLRGRGVRTVRCDLANDTPPFAATFDAVFLSEVIEHLPIPGHVVLARLRAALRPRGLLVCTTPNLYRLRNIAYLVLGRPLFDHFDLPASGQFGHVLEYSAEHLAWQVERAGYRDYEVELCDFHHVPVERADRVLAWCGAPLHRIPRFRDALVVTAIAP
jgi:SAM-dependent methyltransferase